MRNHSVPLKLTVYMCSYKSNTVVEVGNPLCPQFFSKISFEDYYFKGFTEPLYESLQDLINYANICFSHKI